MTSCKYFYVAPRRLKHLCTVGATQEICIKGLRYEVCSKHGAAVKRAGAADPGYPRPLPKGLL